MASPIDSLGTCWYLHIMVRKIRIGVLVSGGGTNLKSILEATRSNRIEGDVVFVGSDNAKAYGLERGKRFGIPTFAVDYSTIVRQARQGVPEGLLPPDFDLAGVVDKQGLFDASAEPKKLERYFSGRAIAEAALLNKMQPYPFDLLVLAGFMRIFTPYFIDHINTDLSLPRIMNIHPALLPSFPGVDGYGDTYRYGCKVGGCTVHFVDYGEDTGPIIGQRAFEIMPHDTLDTVRRKGLKLEWELYPACIQLFARGRLKVVRKTYKLPDGSELVRKVVKISPGCC